QRRLAHVGPADDRQPHRIVVFVHALGLGQHGDHVVEQIGQAVAVHGGDRVYLAHSQAVEFDGLLGLTIVVDLVDDEKDGGLGAAERVGQVVVGGGEAIR